MKQDGGGGFPVFLSLYSETRDSRRSTNDDVIIMLRLCCTVHIIELVIYICILHIAHIKQDWYNKEVHINFYCIRAHNMSILIRAKVANGIGIR